MWSIDRILSDLVSFILFRLSLYRLSPSHTVAGTTTTPTEDDGDGHHSNDDQGSGSNRSSGDSGGGSSAGIIGINGSDSGPGTESLSKDVTTAAIVTQNFNNKQRISLDVILSNGESNASSLVSNSVPEQTTLVSRNLDGRRKIIFHCVVFFVLKSSLIFSNFIE